MSSRTRSQHSRSAAVQPDLFGDYDRAVDAAAETDRARIAGACRVLADVHPHALEILIGERRPDRGEIKVGLTHPWAYSVRREGFRWEREDTWGGWYSKPAHLAEWAELDALTAGDPRVGEVRAWSTALTAIDTWKDRYRPFELWPPADSWHPSYLEHDHERAGWDERLRVWLLVIGCWCDAAARTEAA